jgi:hypothetical protein
MSNRNARNHQLLRSNGRVTGCGSAKESGELMGLSRRAAIYIHSCPAKPTISGCLSA